LDIRRYAWLIWRWIWLFALCAALGAGAGYLYSRLQTPIFQANTTLLVNEASAKSASTDYNALMASERLTRTYAQMITTQPLLEQVIKQLQLSATPASLAGSITVSPVRDTQLITIAVESPDPGQAAKVADTLVAAFTQQVRELQTARFTSSKENLQTQMTDLQSQIDQTAALISKERDAAQLSQIQARQAQYRQALTTLVSNYEQIRLAEAQTTNTIVQVEPAVLEPYAVRPKIMQNTVLAGLAGLLLALAFVLVLDYLDDTIKDPEDLSRRVRLPILATIGQHTQVYGEVITQNTPRSPVSEAFRRLRTNVQYAAVDTPLRRLVVTSALPEDGKTTIVSNLAVVLAQSGQRVTLVDADMRRPRVHKQFGLANNRGLSSLFAKNHLGPEAFIYTAKTENLEILPCGEIPPNPAELLASKRMREILIQLEGQCDITLIDTPPVLSVTDSCALAPAADGVLLVVKPGFTKQAALIQAVEELRRANARLLGIVLNDVNARSTRYYHYYRGYTDRYTRPYTDEGDNLPPAKKGQPSAAD
jgi:non-specific protein-tyrosine kinase